MARGIDVDTRGLVVPGSCSGAIDVLLDGQRVWSFNPDRDGRAGSEDTREVAWPKALVQHLEGVADVELVDHVSRDVLHTQTVRFGRGEGRVGVVDAEGNPLAVDKGGRLQRDFSNTEDSARDEIMDALEKVMHDLTVECGLDTYLMYGCLLGAIRDGHMIGHDSDADVAYLSAHTHPFDIIRECTAAIRRMKALGWKVVKMSGANFKVWVPLPDGRRCGIDVFGSFHIGDRFYVTGSLTGPLDRSALLPFGTVTLEGREITAPARPEEVLAFTYGPHWRVPDPAFHFDHDPVDVARMDAWFRGPRRRLRFWHDFYKSPDATRVPTEPSSFAHWTQQRLVTAGRGDGTVLDAGAGTGRDTAYFAGQGHRVVALDFSTLGMRQTKKLREDAAGRVTVRSMNFEDLRSVLVTGTRFAHRGGVREVYARGLLDTLGPVGRDNFWRFASMVQRRGGETFLEFRTPQSRQEPKHFGVHLREYVDPDLVAREVAAYGGTVVHRETGRGLAPLGTENPHIARIVVRWTP
ncbi:methyltransferase domain-containing protein [Nocardioides panacis]|uniref:Methyltransferase domain-containing protein n=1 Tax=Nocardioides panacis TaxID=2849501 RepID=A0A975Y0K0_9ACTN|nr:methyltransferase domain-containing protein [Nocardioides panacis]